MRRTALKQGALAALVLVVALAAFRVVEMLVTPRFELQIGLDGAIPFIPWTIFVYQSFLFFVVAASLFLDPDEFRRTFSQIAVAVAVGLACFVALPASISRPDAAQIADPFLRQRFIRLWWLDESHNTFPSLHIAITWIVAAALADRFPRGPGAWLAAATASAISVSTLTVKQHGVVDVAGGVALAAVVLMSVSPRGPSKRRDSPSARPLAPGTDTVVAAGLTDLSAWRSLGALAMDWGLIVLCFAAAIRFAGPLTYCLAALLIARTQLALAVLMHESAHGLLLRPRAGNDLLGQVFAAAPLLVSLPVYRYGHLKHHRAPMASDDPVAIVFEITDYPIAPWRLGLRLLRDVSGVANCLNLYRFGRGDFRSLLRGERSDAWNALLVPVSIVAAQGVMLGVLTWVGRPELYAGLWLLPMVTLFQAMGRVRAIMEHAGYPPGADQARNARTIVRPSWQTFFFGPHGVHFHIEHHEHVRVPFYRLAKVHEVMAAQGRLPPENLYSGYGAVLREVTRSAGALTPEAGTR